MTRSQVLCAVGGIAVALAAPKIWSALTAPSPGKRVAVVLSGCGVFDGSEIQEAVACLVELSRNGASATCFAPNIPHTQVVDHTTGNPEDVGRNVMVEASRISRGKIKDLESLNVDDFDAIVFPGGFGVAKNLSTLATEGAKMSVEPSVVKAILAFHEAQKPQAFSCIAPAIAAKVICGCTITLGGATGDDWPYNGTIGAVNSLKAQHVEKRVDEICVDEANKVVSTPAYMYGPASPSEVSQGISAMILQLLRMA